MTFFTPVTVKYMEKNLGITKPRYSEHVLPVTWPFVISKLHCRRIIAQAIPSVLIPPTPGIFRAFLILEICQKTSAPRSGICQFF